MSNDAPLLLIEPGGTLRAGNAELSARLAQSPGEYALIASEPPLLVLRDRNRSGARVLMAGEAVSRMTMMEIINVIATTGWRGDLHVYDRESHRVLSFDQGALKNASSSHPDDRLGEVLYRLGVLSRAQLDELLAEVTPQKRFGQLCVERGIADQETLFQHLHKQAEQIFFAALLVHEGAYAFVMSGENASPASAATLHVPIQGLLMEGVQRIDEMALFRERIPHGKMVPDLKTGAPEKKLEPGAQTVLAYCDGQRTIEDIGRETGLGEFDATKAIYHLVQQGQVVLHSGTALDEQAVRNLLVRFNDIMRDIFVAVATYGGIDQTRQTLAAWIQGSGYAPYFGDTVEEDGSIDIQKVIESLKQTDHPRPVEALHQALHELAAFALFSATTALPRDQELSLARDVNRRLKAIRM